jgi:hypothetical protein
VRDRWIVDVVFTRLRGMGRCTLAEMRLIFGTAPPPTGGNLSLGGGPTIHVPLEAGALSWTGHVFDDGRWFANGAGLRGIVRPCAPDDLWALAYESSLNLPSSHVEAVLRGQLASRSLPAEAGRLEIQRIAAVTGASSPRGIAAGEKGRWDIVGDEGKVGLTIEGIAFTSAVAPAPFSPPGAERLAFHSHE